MYHVSDIEFEYYHSRLDQIMYLINIEVEQIE